MDYETFLESKRIRFDNTGFEVAINKLNVMLFDWQKIITRWALIKGKSALFEDCGLGKTPQQLEWANRVYKETRGDVLIFAPLAVSQQTVREGRKFGIPVNICKSQNEIKRGINITNYERIDSFDPKHFKGIVLDESSIIKNFAAQFRNKLIDNFISIPYKLCCSATPAPNDYTELGNTAEFLGVMTRSEMLSMFFINDAGDTTAPWRLKGHVQNNIFWEWLASWCVAITKPSDIGYGNDGFILPELIYHEHIIPYKGQRHGFFVDDAKGLSDIRSSMRETLEERTSLCADIINSSKEIWVSWCSLNDESKSLKAKIKKSIEVKGADSQEYKEKTFLDFADNKIKCLVTKPKIAMFGMNWQNCNNIVVTGMSHSYEQFYQLVRRFYRFGQTKPVNVHIVIGEREGSVLETIKRKDKEARQMYSVMVDHMRNITKSELQKSGRSEIKYNPEKEMRLPQWL
jgi:hypothetical protein